MNAETIHVQYVNPPKPGKKKGTIKTTDGKLFGVWANTLSEFEPNETYAVEYTEEEWRGQSYRTITKATLEANRTAGPSPQRSRNSHRETSPADAERMFVCSLLKAEIGAGKLSLKTKELIEAIERTRAAWAKTFGSALEPGQAERSPKC
jgi:hypothetical protein